MIENNKPKYPYSKTVGKSKSRSLFRPKSKKLDEFTINERVGAIKSTSTGKLYGVNKKRQRSKIRTRTKPRSKSQRSTSLRTSTNHTRMVKNADRLQTENMNQLMSDWEHEYYHLMGYKKRSKKSTSGSKKRKSASLRRRLTPND